MTKRQWWFYMGITLGALLLTAGLIIYCGMNLLGYSHTLTHPWRIALIIVLAGFMNVYNFRDLMRNDVRPSKDETTGIGG